MLEGIDQTSDVTGGPGPEALAPLFPMSLVGQEVSREPWVDIPEEVRDAYKLWRPTPLWTFTV